MATLKHLGLIPETTASGANATYNLLNAIVGTDGEGLGEIAANASGPLGTKPTTGGSRGLTITVDNRDGTADAYLARPEDIPGAGTETKPLGALVFPAGQITEYEGLDYATFSYVLRLLDGATVRGTVAYTGQGW